MDAVMASTIFLSFKPPGASCIFALPRPAQPIVAVDTNGRELYATQWVRVKVTTAAGCGMSGGELLQGASS